MSATVAWSPTLRLAVKKCKEIKTTTYGHISHEQLLTTDEEQALQKQMTQKSEDVSGYSTWWQ